LLLSVVYLLQLKDAEEGRLANEMVRALHVERNSGIIQSRISNIA
jgi:hypothetical protein